MSREAGIRADIDALQLKADNVIASKQHKIAGKYLDQILVLQKDLINERQHLRKLELAISAAAPGNIISPSVQ